MRVRLTPGASRDRIDGLLLEADGGAALKVAVTAVAEDGKANAALIGMLAREWKRPKSSISLASGASNRSKVLHIAGEPEQLLHVLDDWLANTAAER